MAIAYVGIGANLGDRLSSIRIAIDQLGTVGRVRASSPLYETAPVGFVDQPPFLNAVVEIETELAPAELLTRLLSIETELGRMRSFRNAPRVIDLDLLLYDNLEIVSHTLTLPHPRLHERAFVLVPLNDIGPELVVPGIGRKVKELLEELGPITGVERTPD